jgi:hypothetical protein
MELSATSTITTDNLFPTAAIPTHLPQVQQPKSPRDVTGKSHQTEIQAQRIQQIAAAHKLDRI